MRDRIRRSRSGPTSAAMPRHAKMAWSSRVDALKEPWHSPQTLREELQKVRQPFPLPGLDHGRCTKGQQAHHGADLEPSGGSIREAQDVVVEPILFVPHAIRSHPVHGVGDPEKMVAKLRC